MCAWSSHTEAALLNPCPQKYIYCHAAKSVLPDSTHIHIVKLLYLCYQIPHTYILSSCLLCVTSFQAHQVGPLKLLTNKGDDECQSGVFDLMLLAFGNGIWYHAIHVLLLALMHVS